MEGLNDVTALGQYGLIGVMISLILLCAVAVYFLWKLACNHIEHGTKAINENTEVLAALHQLIKDKLK